MEAMDSLWLSPQVIEHLSVLNEHLIHKMNCQYDLRNPNKLHKFETITFTEALFMQLMYLQGHLWSNPFGKNIQTNYFTQNRCILVELCRRGLFTIHGSTSPLCYEFIVVIHDRACNPFVEMLFTIASIDDIAIFARRLKHRKSLCDHAFGATNVALHQSFSNIDFVKKHIDMCYEHNMYHVKIMSNIHMVEDIVLHYWLSFNSTWYDWNSKF